MSIPRILHQLAKTDEIPPHLQGFQESWTRLNPEFSYHLWTNITLEAWVADQAPEFLELYRSYPRPICRAALGRYLLLDRIGGVYADLDCQCLQPMAGLLEGRELALACEPDAHHNQVSVQERGLEQIVCPSFIASRPGHPLWVEVLGEIRRVDPRQVQTSTDVLDAKGPFLLSRVFAANPRHNEHLLPSAAIYPFSKNDCWDGLIFDPAFWAARTATAAVAHYWDSSWFRASTGWRAGVPSQAPVHVRKPNAPPQPGSATLPVADPAASLPLISCLMVTRGRTEQVQLAIRCFLAQTHGNKELVVVDDDPDSQLAAVIRAADSTQIRHLQLPDEGLSLGRLRNLALDNAKGDYVCQWDDDDLHDPVRLEVQYQALKASGAQAAVLARWMIWWPQLGRLAVSRYRDWEGSLLCERSSMLAYPDQRRGEDSVLLASLMENITIASIDLPRLYVCVCHGSNTFEAEHFEPHWQHATAQWQGADCDRLEQELDRRLPLLRYRSWSADQEARRRCA